MQELKSQRESVAEEVSGEHHNYITILPPHWLLLLTCEAVVRGKGCEWDEEKRLKNILPWVGSFLFQGADKSQVSPPLVHRPHKWPSPQG